MRRALAILALLGTGLGAVALDGSNALGRAALTAGFPGLAAPFLTDTHWRGAALHRAGRFDEAAELFRQVGAAATYNRGTTLARAGRLREAIEAYTAVLARDPGDEDARFNLALLQSIYDAAVLEARPGDDLGGDGSAEKGSTPSDVQAPGAGSERGGTNNLDTALVVPRQLSEQEVVRQNFDNQGIAANRQWLATLADQPGRYLKARIKAEHERRVTLGIALPPAGDPE